MRAFAWKATDSRVERFLKEREKEVHAELLKKIWSTVRTSLGGLESSRSRRLDHLLVTRAECVIRALTPNHAIVERVHLISAYHPLSQPEWMSDMVYQDAVQNALASRLHILFNDRMREDLQVQKGLTNDVWMWLGAFVRDLCDDIFRELQMPIASRRPTRHAIFDAVFAVCGYAAAGRMDRVAMFTPFFREMRNGLLVLGDRKDHPTEILLLDTRSPYIPMI